MGLKLILYVRIVIFHLVNQKPGEFKYLSFFGLNFILEMKIDKGAITPPWKPYSLTNICKKYLICIMALNLQCIFF